MNIRPSKWILYAPVAALPLLAALMINGNSVQQDLLNRGEAALKAAGATWAKLSISGRDATLTGEAASDDDAKAAARVAAATHGIRLVKQAVVIKPPPPPPPPELKAPTVTAYAGESSPKTIVGTWDEGNAAGLTVAIPEAKIAAELGKDAALTSDGRGNWSLALKQDLPPGTYDVQVTETAKDGRSATHSGAKEIEVKAPPPPPELKRPTATAYAGAVSPTAITGTWDEGNAAALSVAIPDAKIAAELGKDAALSSDGKGNWSLTLAQKLAPGAYDVVATETAKDGRTAKDASSAEIYVKAPPPPPPPELKVPTVTAFSGAVSPTAITGTWDEGNAAALMVAIPDAKIAAELGKDAALSSDGKGNWSLALAKKLPPGAYDVVVTETAKDGRMAKDASTGEIVVKAAPPPPPPPPELKLPTVTAFSGDTSPKAITGTWDEGNAAALTVAIPDTKIAAELGKDAALTSDGKGNWSLTLAQKLAPGAYDVVATEIAKDGRTAKDASSAEIYVKAPPPPPPPPPPQAELKLPTVTAFSGDTSPTAITGTWDEGNAAALSVAIPDAKIAAELGKDAALSSDGKGNWSLMLAQKLAPGAYDVVATETAKDGRTAKDASSAEIYVKAPPSPPPPPPPELKVPTVATFTGQSSPKAITGSWDEANATALSVAIPDAKVSAELGKDPNLISDGKGHWALVLKQNLAHGTYDVVVTETAKDGRMAKDASTGEIVVKAAPPPPSPPPPPPYDCVGVLAKVSATFPILFDFAEEKLHPPYDLSVNQAAALLKDPRCASLKAEVTGYADYYGGRLYNVALSVQRAQVVVDALIAAGVDGSRLSVTGLGKSNPLDPSHNRLARAKNRRVVITIVKSE